MFPVVSIKAVRLSEDVVPVGKFKARAAQWLRRANESGQPVVITVNGRPAGVVISPTEFDRLLDRQGFLESVAAGIEDAESGRVMDPSTLRRRLAARRRDRVTSGA